VGATTTATTSISGSDTLPRPSHRNATHSRVAGQGAGRNSIVCWGNPAGPLEQHPRRDPSDL